MVGNNNLKKGFIDFENSTAPAVILIRTQLSENIGTTARAMMNCDLCDLRLVNPKESHLSDKALGASSGAQEILKNAKVFDSFEEAVADCNYLLATSARRRDMIKDVFTAEGGAKELRNKISQGQKCGLVFGPERTGINNDEMAMCDAMIEIPLNPYHCSLNLAQAVLLVGYEWFKSGDKTAEHQFFANSTKVAKKESLIAFFSHLEKELDECGYLRLGDKRPKMVRNIRNIFQRGNLTEQEISTLHGIVSDLVIPRKRKEKNL